MIQSTGADVNTSAKQTQSESKMKPKVCPHCETKVINYIKNSSSYNTIISKFERRHRYNFRNNIKIKHLTNYILDMIMCAESPFLIHGQSIDSEIYLYWKCDHFDNQAPNIFWVYSSYFNKIIKSFLVAEIFNTITNKKNKDLLSLIRTKNNVMDMIILKLYELRSNEPITGNWKGVSYYFNEIINMPIVLYDQGIPIKHYQTLHNKLGKHSEFDALIHASPMASHGLMYDSFIEIQKLYENL